MTKRDVVLDALAFRPPAYVPWSWGPTQDCAQRLRKHLGIADLGPWLDPHFAGVGQGGVRVVREEGHLVTDTYGVTWDRTVDRDIGTPCRWPINRPEDLDRYRFPDAADPAWYAGYPEHLARCRDRFTMYALGFSLFERAWTLRGMEDLLTDMIERPAFVERLLDAIVEHNLVQVGKAVELGVDCMHFGDDYGMQTGLIMGRPLWVRFIKPRLARMFEPARAAGLRISLHSCGRVQEVFDDLVEIGLNLFNPFQPEVMDVFEMLPRYRGLLAFHGGMSIQKVLPFGTAAQVREMTRRLIQAGRDGGYVFSPSHSVPRDVPPENLAAMMDELKSQPGYRADEPE